MMISTLKTVVLDTPDHTGLARFYADLMGWEQLYTDHDWVTLTGPEGVRVAFQLAPDHVPPRWPDPAYPQQFHLDLLVPDLAAATATAESLGATRLGAGETWTTLADPSGHPFDLCAGDKTGLYAVTIDCPEPKELAAFYAELFGMERRYDGDEGSLIGADGQMAVMFQKVADYRAPRWPDPAYPQQLHIDTQVTDIEVAEPQALALGATRLTGGGDDFRVYADPAGHPFCLVW
jgi:catechol-2,3-dioxygenase